MDKNGSPRKAVWQVVAILVAGVAIAIAIGWIVHAVGSLLSALSAAR